MKTRNLVKSFLMLTLLSTATFANQAEVDVKFKPGTHSASFKGSITDAGIKSRGEQRDEYTLGARKGQIMKIEMTSKTPCYIYVWKDSFNQGFILDAEGGNIVTRFQLPSDGDYKVDVNRLPGSGDLYYDIKFTIRD